MRAPYQVLIIPYFRETDGVIKYAIFKRDDMKVWQAVSGGGEEGEMPMESAKRELSEEIGVEDPAKLFQLQSTSSIPVEALRGFIWGSDVFVVPEYSFGLELKSKELKISHEHETYEWVSYDEARQKLQFDSNKTALWELNARLIKN